MTAVRGALLACTLAGCARAPHTAQPETTLDPQGQAMLDPVREHALKPEELVRRLGLRTADRVADLGAGPGFWTPYLGRAVTDGRVIATDLRADYLAVAADRARGAGLENVETRVADAASPGLERASVDLALLCQLDHYLKDRTTYFRAVRDALKPGGRIALVNYARYEQPDRAALAAAGYQVTDEWHPSPPFFLLVARPDR
jgi:ubiquinone/menaquinone biosynthesis C-methylase UbiE